MIDQAVYLEKVFSGQGIVRAPRSPIKGSRIESMGFVRRGDAELIGGMA